MTDKDQKKRGPKQIIVTRPEDPGDEMPGDEPVTESSSATGGEQSFPAETEESPEIVTELENELERLRNELAEMTENWQRERAGFQNYKRRVEEEKRDIRKYASFDLALDLVRILDYFKSSVTFSENLPPEAANVIIGVKYTIKELNRILAANNVLPVEAEKGRPFDSALMQAVELRETDEVPPDSVLEVQRPGWLLHDRILRPAQVVVAAQPSESGSGKSSEKGDEIV
jgi:molecular chaperone GrpE